MATDAGLQPYLPDPAWFDERRRDGIHGWAHVTRVLVWADVIARALGEPVRLEELRWAAACHDVARVNDEWDEEHGERAGEWARLFLPSLRPLAARADLTLVQRLCALHDVGEVPGSALELRVLKDADALDRSRFKRHGRMNPDRIRLTTVTPLLAGPAQAFCDICRIERPGSPEAILRVAEERVLPSLGTLWPGVWGEADPEAGLGSNGPPA